MFLPIVVFVILLAIFLYWKFGTRISLPGLGGVGARMEGFLGSLSPTSTDGKKRLEFLFLLVLVLLGAWIVTPFVYTWFGVNKELALLIFLIIIGYIVKGPSGTFVPKVAILALVLAGIYVSLPAENALKEWFNVKTSPVAVVLAPLKTIRTTVENIIAVPDDFKRIRFPAGATMIEGYTVSCYEGCRLRIDHSIMSNEVPICSKGLYKGQRCEVTKLVPSGNNRNEYRAEEVFYIPSGDGVFPTMQKLRAFTLEVSAPGKNAVPVVVTVTSS